ncbi:uncharacterized protein LOC111347442 [Stylophora pistillata]|uniref:uncharacterized protein LOC111347442 n=1 Tax=Stylophora pistillata TaxID=50429 RepID=UPI000C04325C|nr:uncharacterized protein LOC111347442 [Stylophora pistillata]
MFNKIAQYRVLSTIDLQSAYHQVPIKDEDKLYTALETRHDLYHFTRLPFGVTNGVACLQREMMKFAAENNLEAVFPYLDNVTVCGLLCLVLKITDTKYSNPRREDLSKEDETERQMMSEVREQFRSNMEGKDTTHGLYYHLQSLGLNVKAAEDGSLKITVECRTLKVLQCLWEEYTSGCLNTTAESYFLTDDMKRRYNVTSVSLKTTILEEDYLACKNFLVAHENQQLSTNKGEYLSQVQTETAFTPDIPAAEKVGSGASGLNYEDNLEHMQAARRLCQEEETQEMESGKLSQADSVKKPIREVHQNGQPPVKVVQVSGEEGEKKMRITLKCPDLNSLQSLWEDYPSGCLNAAAARCLLTDKIKEKFGVESISVETTILEKDYLACREYLSENIGEKNMIKEEREQLEKKEEVKKQDNEESKIMEDKERITERKKGEKGGKNEEKRRK